VRPSPKSAIRFLHRDVHVDVVGSGKRHCGRNCRCKVRPARAEQNWGGTYSQARTASGLSRNPASVASCRPGSGNCASRIVVDRDRPVTFTRSGDFASNGSGKDAEWLARLRGKRRPLNCQLSSHVGVPHAFLGDGTPKCSPTPRGAWNQSPTDRDRSPGSLKDPEAAGSGWFRICRAINCHAPVLELHGAGQILTSATCCLRILQTSCERLRSVGL